MKAKYQLLICTVIFLMMILLTAKSLVISFDAMHAYSCAYSDSQKLTKAFDPATYKVINWRDVEYTAVSSKVLSVSYTAVVHTYATPYTASQHIPVSRVIDCHR